MGGWGRLVLVYKFEDSKITTSWSWDTTYFSLEEINLSDSKVSMAV